MPTRPFPALLLLALLTAGCLGPLTGGGNGGAGDEGVVTFPGLRFETRLGTFTAIVFENETPLTSEFIGRLVDEGYYDGRSFGRVIPGFVIQEVDRTGGTTDQPEKVPLEAPTRVMFSAGAFGIARDADPDSGGSEFFVMDHAVSPLYANYTAFAQVVEGLEVVHAIARVPAVRTGPAGAVASAPPGSPVYFGVHDRVPVEPVVMDRVTRVPVELPAGEAARYPLRVGETVRTDAMRATLEWPADLRAGRESVLTWYVAARDTTPAGSARDPPPFDLAGVTLRIDGPSSATIEAPTVDEAVGSVLFLWTPGAAGEHTVRLVRGGTELAATLVTVPS